MSKLSYYGLIVLSVGLIAGVAPAQTPTTTTLSVSGSNPLTFGQSLSITATITPIAATGKVTFYDGATVLGIRSLSSGAASIATSLLPSGANRLMAYYAGDANDAASASAVALWTVNATAAVTLTQATGNPFTAGVSVPFSVAVGDFNGDGSQDLAIANDNGNSVAVLLGNGAGGFSAAPGSPFAVGVNPESVAVGDFNGDGIPDLVTTNLSSNNVTVLLGNGTGGFSAAAGSPFAVGGSPRSVAVGDFNRDGIPDLVTANSASGNVTVLLGNGTGGFSAAAGSPFAVGSDPYSVAVGDFNRDGNPDLVTANLGNGNVTVLLGDGTGGFSAATGSPFAVGTSPEGVAVGDFNGDGIPDLVTANEGSSNVTVLLGNGAGGFSAATGSPFAVGTSPEGIAVGDFNGDGIPDIVTANVSSGNVTILLGNGAGGFSASPRSPLFVGTNPLSVVVGEFNGDGRADIAVANESNSNVAVLLGSSTAPVITTTTALTSSANPSTYAQNLTFTAIVTPSTTPGTVTFKDGSTTLTTSTLFSGVATYTGDTLAAGSHSITAVYAGDGNDASSTSPAVVQTINVATPVLTMGSSANPSALGQSVTLFATITPTLATGTVTFNDGSSTLGTGTPSLGTATLVVPNFSAGTHALTVSYAGDGSDTAATSPTLSQVVDQPTTTTTMSLTSGVNPSDLGQSVTLTAAVTPSSATGNATFYDGTTVLGTKALAGGQATLSTKLLPSGVRSLKAYLGTGPVYASSTAALAQTVTALPASGFAPAASYPGGAGYALAIADFNGDGKADFVTSNFSTIQVALGNGDGTFQAPVSYGAGNGIDSEPLSIAVGDFNGDGKTDIVVSNYNFGNNNTGGSIGVLLGNGDGTFQTAVSYAVGGNSQDLINFDIAVADFNGDGNADIAVDADANGALSILLGNGDGTFQPAVNYAAGGSDVSGIVSADFNGDGKADLALSGFFNGNGVEILLGNGDGTFQTPVPYASGTFGYLMAVGDFNGDGKADLAVGGSNGTGLIYVLLGKGDGTFQPAVSYSAGTYPYTLVTGDFNGDGKADLAAPDYTSGQVSVLLGNGDGTFQTAVTYSVTGSQPFSVATGDFNGDNRTDLIVGQFDGNNVNVLLGIPSNLTGTTTTLTSSLNPSASGQAVTFTAAVSASVATGTVTFRDGATILCTSAVSASDSTANATCTTTTLTAGSNTITASYSGDQTYASSTASTLTQTVSVVTPVISSLAPSSAAAGEPAFTLTVNGTNFVSGATVEWGTTALTTTFVSGTQLTAAVGTAQIATAGTVSVTVVNPGPATSNAATFTVNSSTVTTTMLTSSLNPSVYGQLIELTATIKPPTATGTVTFLDGAASLGTFNLNNGTAGTDQYGLSAGSHALTAVYSGDENDSGSTSSIVTQTVAVATPTVSIISSANPSAVGQSVTLIASVSPSLATGTVTFKDGATTLGTGTLSQGVTGGGVATLTLSTLATGSHSLTVTYGGDANDTTGTSPVLTQVVDQPENATTLSLGSSVNASFLSQNVTLTATVTPTSATGNVTFYDGTTVLETKPVTGGQASLTTDLLPSGVQSLKAYFGLNANDGASTSTALTQTVDALPANGFQPSVSYPSSAGPVSVAVADFNGDGRPDVAVADQSGNGVSVFIGNGDGTFQAAAYYATGSGASGVATGDFNGDGKTDLAVLNEDVSNVSILLGNGDGTFQPAVNYSVGAFPDSIVVADFNGDGRADLAVAVGPTNNVNVLLGNGDGTFQAAVRYAVDGYPIWVAAGDFNGDGKADLVTANTGSGNVSVLLGNGDGTFQTAVRQTIGGYLNSVAVGDLNGDGKQDLVVTDIDSVSVYVLLGKGDGTFQTPVSYSTGSDPQSVAVGDFNGDGKADLAVADSGVSVLLGNGDGTFQPATNYGAESSPQDLAVGDFNRDGRTDLAVADEGSNNVGILLGIPTTAATTTVLTSSLNPSVYGQSVTLTATVSPSIASGTVTFFDGTTSLGTASLSSGVASLTVSTLTAASHSISAVYGGDADDAGSTSNAVTQVVTVATLTISSLNPSSANAGEAAFTLTVNGTNFVSGATVEWGTMALTTTFVSGTQLTAAVGTAQIATAGTVSVTVVNPGPATSNAATFTVNGNPLGITTGSNLGIVPIGQVQLTLNATGGNGTYTWSVAMGSSLPPGVNIASIPNSVPGSAGTGVVGIATTPGNYAFSLSVTSGGQTVTQAFTLKLTPLAVKDTFNLPDGFANSPYSYTFTPLNNAGPVTFTSTNSLPAGLNLSASGLLSGTPTVPGTYNIDFSIFDGTDTVSRSFQLIVYAVNITTPGQLPNGASGAQYSTAITAGGGSGSYTYAITGGSLPAGLTMNGGVISGTPAGGPGISWFYVTATDTASNSYQKTMSIDITGAVPALPDITVGTVDDPVIGVTYDWQLSLCCGGTAPFTWSATGLPPGMSIRSGSGVTSNFIAPGYGEIWGVPLATGNYPVQVTVTDAMNASATVAFTLHVSALTLAPFYNPPTGTINTPYSTTFQIIGGTPGYSISTAGQPTPLPDGLSLNAASIASGFYTVAGTPLENGNFNPSSQISDNAGNTLFRNNFLTINNVAGNSISINNGANLGEVTVGASYSNQLTACCVTSYVWSNSGDGLPPGITLSPGGLLSGTANTAGTYTFLVEAADAANAANPGFRQFTLLVTPISITTSSVPFGNLTVAYTATFAASGGTGALNWTLTNGSYLPPGLTLLSNGMITGTPTGTGQFIFNVTVTDASNNTANRYFTLNVYPAGALPPVDITNNPNMGTLPIGQVETTLNAMGGNGTYTWSVAMGSSLPPGLNIASIPNSVPGSAGTGIVGIATTPGNYAFSLSVTSNGQTFTQAFTLKLTPLAVKDTFNLPDGFANSPYSYTFTPLNNAGPVTFTSTNSLPAGLNLSASGLLSGTPTVPGTYNIDFSIFDGTDTVSRGFQLIVYAVNITTPGQLPNGASGAQYSTAITAGGGSGSYTYAITGGSLPAGLTMNGGVISGAPTGGPGVVGFSVTATDSSSNSYQKSMSIDILGAVPALPDISVAIVDDPVVGVSYAWQFPICCGGSAPFTWTASGLPAGMSIRWGSGVTSDYIYPGYGEIWGVASAVGNYPVQLTVTDAIGASATIAFTLHVSPLTLAPFYNLPTGTINTSYSTTFQIIGGTPGYSIAPAGRIMPLPDGLSLNAASVASGFYTVAGTPLENGNFDPAYQISDNAGNTLFRNNYFNINNVAGNSISINNGANLGEVTVGASYSNQLTACCVTSYVWSNSGDGLPPGITLSPGGLLSGTANTAGTYTFLVEAADAANAANPGFRQFTLLVTPISITTSSVPFGNLTVAYTATFAASGGTGALNWTLTNGSYLPPGLTLLSNGMITGTPTGTGQFIFNVTVTDASNNTANRYFTLNVYPAGAAPPATITGLSPYSATAGGPAFTLTVGGTNFVAGSTVQWGTTTLSTTFGSATQITASVSQAQIAAAGPVNVTVVNPGPVTSAASTFTILAPTPQTWTQLMPSGGPPSAREGAGSVLDAATTQMILFGGDANSGYVNDTWSLNTTTNQWSQLAPAGTAPTARRGLSAVYDSANSIMTVFGGQGSGNTCDNDVWTLSNANGSAGTPTWAQLSPTGTAPPPRSYAQAVYDPGSDSMIVFGGTNCVLTAQYNDVWVLSNANGLGGTPAWTQLTPTGTLPPVRNGASAVYDPASNEMIIFGGSTGTAEVNDLWVLSHANGLGGTPAWTLVTPAGGAIPARAYPTAVYDPASNRMTVYGGFISFGLGVSDTWVLTNANNTGGTPTWTQLAPSGTIPPARAAQTAILDPATNRMVVFGGFNDVNGSFVILNDTWALSDANNVTPSITSLSPNSVTAGGAAFTLTVNGQGFASGAVVNWNGTALTTTFVNATQLTAPVTANLVASTGTASVTVVNPGGATSAPATFTINSAIRPLSITSGGPPNGTVNIAYGSFTLTATGGSGSYLWSASGVPGLSVNAGTGVVSGTPTSAGNLTLTVTVTDANNAASPITQNYSVTIAAGPLTITTSSLPGGTQNRAYSASLAGSGGSGSYNWAIGGIAGLTVNPGTGGISGSPTVGGNLTLTVTLSDALNASATPATRQYTVAITLAPLTIMTPGALGEFAPNAAISKTFAATGGSPAFTWSATGVPATLTLNPTTGQITGNAPATPGSYSFPLKVSDIETPVASDSTTVTFSVLGITTPTTLPSGTTSTAYSLNFIAAGGMPPYTFSSPGVPAGLTLSSSGFLSGTPTNPIASSFQVLVTDASGIPPVAGTFSLTVATGVQPIQVTGAALPDSTLTASYSQPLEAQNGQPSYTWTLLGGALPAGLALSSAGTISGTPTAIGQAIFTARATDSAGGFASGVFTINVNPAALQVTAAALPNAMAGLPYGAQPINATGGYPPYTFALTQGSLPSPLTFNNGQINSGVPTAAGSSNFTVTVTDAMGNTASGSFTLVVEPTQPDLILSQGSVSFSIVSGAVTLPSAANVTVGSSVAASLGYNVQVNPPAAWLDVTPNGTTPGTVIIALDAANAPPLGMGTYQTTVTVACLPFSGCSGSHNIAVSLTVTAPAPQLSVGTNLLSFSATGNSSQTLAQPLNLKNSGGGVVTIQSVSAADSWVKFDPATIPPPPVPLPAGQTLQVNVFADTTVLSGPGYYQSTITVTTDAGSATVPVTVLIAANATMTLALAGSQFNTVAGNAPGSSSGSFLVTVSGNSTVNWTAAVLPSPAATWLTLNTPSGSSTSASPGAVSFSINGAAAGLAAQPWYATIEITSTGSPVTDPVQDYQVVLNVAPAGNILAPNPDPSGLIFISTGPGALPAQVVQVGSSSGGVGYTAQSDSPSWLSVTPASGNTSSAVPGQSSVSVKTAGLANGVFHGGVNYAIAGQVRTVSVTLIVTAPAAGAAISGVSGRAVQGCTATQIIPAQTGLVNNFSLPTAWPAPLKISVADDCGNAVTNGQVVATFSNGDPPLVLPGVGGSAGVYSGTWTPRATASQVTISAQASAPGFKPASVQITGQVTRNGAPVLNLGGTLNAFVPVVGSPLAPGMIVQIYGANLASQVAVSSIIPLTTSLNNTSVIIGGIAAPLYYVSPGQINAQVPFELAQGGSYQVIVNANGALSTPNPIQLAADAPGIAAFASGGIIAQHGDGSLVTEAAPAAPGEYIVFYVSGMGLTDNPVASGAASPGNPLARPTDPPILTLNGVNVPVAFAGLTPTLVGLYQVNFQVPANTPNGDLQLVLTQTGGQSNSTVLAVHN